MKAAEPALRIGILAPLDQPDAISVQQAAQIAGAAAGVQIVCRGKPGQWGTDGNEAAVLALDDEVAGIVTASDGSVAHQALQVSGRTRIPVVTLCPDFSVTRTGVPWAWRMAPQTRDEAVAIFQGARTASRNDPVVRWTALVASGRAGRETAQDLRAAALIAKVELTEVVNADPDPGRPTTEFPPTDTKSAAQSKLTRLISGDPQGVLLWTDAKSAGEYVRLLRKAGYRGCLAGPASLQSNAFLSAAGDAAEGLILATPAALSHALSAQLDSFKQQYTEKYGSAPDYAACLTHDAVIWLVELLKVSRAQSPPFRSPPPLSGLSGMIQFDPSGNRRVPLQLFVCVAGRFKPYPDQTTTLASGSSHER